MRRRPFSRWRSATHVRRTILVDVWNCTVASWSQSVTSSTPFLGFFPARPFAVLIQPGSESEVVLQILARLLFREFVFPIDLASGDRSVQSNRPDPSNLDLVRMIHFSFRVSKLLKPARFPLSGPSGKPILPWAFLLSGFSVTGPLIFHCRR